MELYEGKEEMVAIANCNHAYFGRNFNSNRSKFIFVAFYLCSFLNYFLIILRSTSTLHYPQKLILNSYLKLRPLD